MKSQSTLFSPILRQLDLANFLTLTGLLLDFLGITFAINGKFGQAMICLICVGIIDLFDGFVASKLERTELQSAAGKQLDSLIDLCSFGLVPAVFAYCFGLQDFYSMTILACYMGANALRLAYFNSTGLVQQGDAAFFTGLPVTYAALFIPLSFTASLVLPITTMKFLLRGVYLLLSVAMVANVKIPKPQGVWYGIFALGAVTLTGFYQWVIILGR
jgi:CDP-diacylglycerol--serine O-phosphatidyltransferase